MGTLGNEIATQAFWHCRLDGRNNPEAASYSTHGLEKPSGPWQGVSLKRTNGCRCLSYEEAQGWGSRNTPVPPATAQPAAHQPKAQLLVSLEDTFLKRLTCLHAEAGRI